MVAWVSECCVAATSSEQSSKHSLQKKPGCAAHSNNFFTIIFFILAKGVGCVLVYHELKVYASGLVVLVVLDVLCPGLTPDLHECPVLRARELDEHQRLTVSFLVAVWEVVVSKSVSREEFEIAHEITIGWILKNNKQEYDIRTNYTFIYTWLQVYQQKTLVAVQ